MSDVTTKEVGVNGSSEDTHQYPIEPRSELLDVTPEQATEWLELNVNNRPIREQYVKQLAGAMARGEWVVNGDAIRFSSDGGTLLDGQHRLWAVFQSGVTIRTFVVWGVDPAAMETIDRGKARTLGDVLKLRGETQQSVLATLLNVMVRWRKNQLRNKAYTATVSEALRLFEDDPEAFRSAAKLGANVSKRIRPVSIPTGILAACVYRFRQVGPEDAERFFELLASGAGLAEDDPIFAFRRWLQNQSRQQNRTNTYVLHALLVKAWNYWRDGEVKSYLVFRPGGESPEEFPKPH